MMRLVTLAMLAFLTAMPAVQAQSRATETTPQSRSIALDAAERLLLERNLVVVAAQRGLDAARAQRLVAASMPPPNLSIGNTTGEVNEYGQRLQATRFYWPTNNVAIGLSVVVEGGGRRSLRTRFAEEQISIAEAQVLDILRQQLFQLRQVFLQALLARANLDVAEANKASLDRTEALLRRQAQEGQIPEGDLLRFQASRPAMEADAAIAAQTYASAAAMLAALLAEDPAITLGSSATARPRLGNTGPVALAPSGRLQSNTELGLTRDQILAAAENRADVLVAKRNLSAASANRELAESQRTRDVTVGVVASRTRLPQDLQGTATANNQLGLSLSVPIFTSRIVEGNVGVATAQQGQAEAMARAALLGARADAATAWIVWEQARALRALYDGGALRRAEEAYAVAERAYLAGGRSFIEVLDALRTLNATRIAANQARHGALLALANLEQASGISGLMPRL
ncbi:MAG: TolC family protein [Roseomonas sp.]|nr:TolC family protein [Roseomonas sp.]MCA3326112.1 TolC family protein [Roseomonas sp.]MCA3330453.1 TolC family protein [Roseomonas sp.]MCA3335096.1 TolC family protein [Roseomonas sp.]MCA3346917.1 TolC family protein [Roseomonas sp.]